MIDDTTKRTIKNLGEGIIEKAEEMPDQPQDSKSLIQNWACIKSYINEKIEVIDELVEDINRRESIRRKKKNLAEYTKRQIMGIIDEIVEKSANGNYIYRGEPKCYEMVSSSLWRVLQKGDGISMAIPDIKRVGEMLLQDARRYARDTDIDAFELEAQLQHNGGKTSLIDFTTDYLIALFFACDGEPAKDGRVILLKQDETTRDWIKTPKNPEHRVIAQKSIFVQPLEGCIERCKYGEPIKICKDLKKPMLNYLRKHHGISSQSIYNDIEGYIKHQRKHHEAYQNLWRGGHCTLNGFILKDRDTYDEAIRYYDKAIELHPEFDQAYHERGVAYSFKEEFNTAVADLTKAIELNPDFILSYTERGFNRIRTGDYDGAISDYNWLIKHPPVHPSTYSNLGDAYRRKSCFDSALKECNKAIGLMPNYYYPHKIRGCIYFDQNAHEKAIEDFTTAINSLLDVDEKAVIYDLRGKCYSAMGEETCANDDFAKAEELRSGGDEGERHFQESLLRANYCDYW